MASKFKSPLLQKMFAERGGRLSPTPGASSGRLSPTSAGGLASPATGLASSSQGSSAGSSPVHDPRRTDTMSPSSDGKPEPLQFTDKPATRGTAVTTATTGSNGVSLIQDNMAASGGSGDFMDGLTRPTPGGGVSLMETSLTGSLTGSLEAAAFGEEQNKNNIPFNGFDNSANLIDTR